MHCFICVTYLMIIATAHPPKDREGSKTIEKRSIFHDVIQSLRIRAQLPEDVNSNEENNLGQNFERYSFETEPLELPGDFDFKPRRNDRIEMPTLKYRFPKSLLINSTSEKQENPKEDIVIYVNTPTSYDEETKPSTQRPKKQKRPRPVLNKNKTNNKSKENADTEAGITDDKPFMNTMAGQSQIGNRESQTVVKPTVIVNFRGSVMHRESDIRLERRKNDNDTLVPQNIFNINQEIKLEKNDAEMGSTGGVKKLPAKVKQDVNVVSEKGNTKIEEDMMMCETSSRNDKNDRLARKYDVLQIMVTI